MNQHTLPTPTQFQQMLADLEDTHHLEYQQRQHTVAAVVEQLGLADLYATDPLQAGFLTARLLRQHHERQN